MQVTIGQGGGAAGFGGARAGGCRIAAYGTPRARVGPAESTEADNKAILEVYKQLNALKPPTGDEKAWESRTQNVIAAIQDVIDKKPGAVEKVRGVTECQGCHNAHRVGGNSGK